MERKPLGAVLGLMVALAACGGSGPKATGSVTPTPTATAEAKMFPVIGGYAHGREVTYLLQEISDPAVAQLMTEKTGFNVPIVRSLAKVPPKVFGTLYLFMNGVQGPNPFGFQKNVIDAVPGEPGYSPLWLHTFVKWKDGVTPRELKSEEKILKAAKDGQVTLEKSKLVINCPVLPPGQTNFPVATVRSLADVPPEALADLYLFMNGLPGPNPFGFQKNVIDSVTGEAGYSPLWRHTFVKWKEGKTPRELKSEEEILAAAKAGEVTLEVSKLVINCPVIPSSIQP